MPFDNNNIPYRNSCKNCEYERYCNLDPRDKIFNRKCYVDYVAEKMKITPQLLLKRCDKFIIKYGTDFCGIKNYNYTHWIMLSGREREKCVADKLKWFLRRSETKCTKSEVQLYAAMVNTSLTVGSMRIIFIVQGAGKSSRIVNSVIEDFAVTALAIKRKILIMVFAWIVERSFTKRQIINTDALLAKSKRIKQQHENEQGDTESGKITVQIKKVNLLKC